MRQETFVASPFRKLSLSLSDVKQLETVAETLVEANLDRYLRFKDVDGGNVSLNEWKLVKLKGQVQVYRQLQRQRRSSHDSVQVRPEADTSVVQSTMCLGSMSGKLEDVMQGLTEEKSPSTNDFCRAAVLAKLKKPTPTKPFRFLAVKWAELDVRLKSMGVVKNHDYVYVEAAGILRLPSGERVGYHLMHSVGFSEARVLPDRVRGQLSVCSFFRQVNEASVSIYVLGLMDSLSDRTQRVVVPHFVKSLLSLFKSTHCVKTRSSMMETFSKHYTRRKESDPTTSGDACISCRKPQRKFLSHHVVCNVCSGNVCSTCKVVRELNFVTPDFQMAQRSTIFCASCDDDAGAFSFSKTKKNPPGYSGN